MSQGAMVLRWYLKFGHLLPRAFESRNLQSLYQRIIDLKKD